jgi:tetratricopeptide (TPR) repeat protein
MKKLLLTFVYSILAYAAVSQIIYNPLIKDKTHETMNVKAVAVSDSGTFVMITVTNTLDSGAWFCADKNITIKEAPNEFLNSILNTNSSLKTYQLAGANGIPVCPLKYKFKTKGDSLDFELYFPKLNPIPDFIDIIENCEDHCFKLEGICLNNVLAYQISIYHQAFEDFDAGKTDTAISAFKKVIELKDTTHNMYIYALINLSGIYEQIGDKENAIKLYSKLLTTPISTENESFLNYKHTPALRLAKLYKAKGNLDEALNHLWLADTVYTYRDTSIALLKQKKALLLNDKINAYSQLERYDDALFFGINEIINEELALTYETPSNLLVNLIKTHKNHKKYIEDFNKALTKMVVFEDEKTVSGRFNFEGKQYLITVDKNYTVLAKDPKTKEIRSATIQDKDKFFFIERVKVSDFYVKLKSKN